MNTTPIFISYAREDSEWVQAISTSLASKNIHAWVDTHALDYASLWQEEIEDAILRAQLIVVLVTPHFLDSLACRFEVERAERLRKRLLPVIDSRVEEHQIPPALSAYQWFKLNRDADNANTVATWIERSINLDPQWLKRHTDLTTRAQQWVHNKKDSSLLLRGKDLASAQAMLNQPLSSDLIEMIAVSDQTQSRRRMTLAGFLGGSLLAVISAASFGYIQYVQAEGEAKSALRNRLNQLAMAGDISSMLDTARANAARLEKDPLAMLQVQLFKADALNTNLELKAFEVESLEVKGDWVMLHNFSSGGQLFNLASWNQPQKTTHFSESETHKVSLSDSGNYHAVWTPTQFSIRASSNPAAQTPRITNQTNIQYITVLENTGQLVIQQENGFAVYAWAPGQTDLQKATLQKEGVQLLRAFSNGDLLYRKPPQADGQYEVWIRQQEQGSELLLGRFKGQIRQILRNQDGVLAIRVKREVHGFQATEPLGKVWVADESGVALSNHGHSLAVVDPNNEARILYFSLDDVVVSEGKSLRQNPTALREDLQEKLHALRNGAIQISELHPVFDRDDSRLFAPGEFNRSLSPINAQLIASMDSELGTEGGLSDNILALGGSGHYLLGLSLNHGGNGTVTLHRFSIPARLQQGRTKAIAIAPVPDQSGFWALQTQGQLVQQPWIGSPTSLQLPGLEAGNNALIAGAVSATGEQAWAIHAQGELLAWTRQGEKYQLNFKQAIDMDWLAGLNQLRPVSVSKNSKYLLLTGTQGALLLDAKTGKTQCKLEHTEQFYNGMAYFLDDQTIVSTSMLFTNGTGWENRRIQTFDVKQCTPIERFATRPELQENEGYETGFGFGIQTELGGAPWIADRRFGAKYRILDLQTGHTLGALSNHSGRILALRSHPASRLLISSDENGSINIWESDSLRRIKTLDAPQCQAIDLELNATGTNLLARCANGQAIWWAMGAQP